MIYIDILLYTYIFLIGLFFGSFFNVVGIRVPKKETLLGRSHCPNCGKTLGALELFPVIGYLVLRGRCKNCEMKISVKYVIIELITAVLFLVSFVFLRENVVEYILVVVFISLMVIVTVSDLYYKIVPDIILLVFLPVIFVLRLVGSDMTWYYSLLGGIFGFGFMYLVSWYGKKRFKKEALGGGDIKLYFLIGLFLGVELVIPSIMFAAILGLIYSLIFRKRSGYLPFVPFIFMGSMIAYTWGNILLDWYIRLIF